MGYQIRGTFGINKGYIRVIEGHIGLGVQCFPKLGVLFGGPSMKDYSILGSTGVPVVMETRIRSTKMRAV